MEISMDKRLSELARKVINLHATILWLMLNELPKYNNTPRTLHNELVLIRQAFQDKSLVCIAIQAKIKEPTN